MKDSATTPEDMIDWLERTSEIFDEEDKYMPESIKRFIISALKKEKALKRFSDAVSIDNGDVTYHWHHITSKDLFVAHSLMRKDS